MRSWAGVSAIEMTGDMRMAPRRRRQRGQDEPGHIDHATFQRSDYGRVVRADGTTQWWVRAADGTWTALAHQRIMENDDGTITLLYLK